MRAGFPSIKGEHVVGTWRPNIYESRTPENIKGAYMGAEPI